MCEKHRDLQTCAWSNTGYHELYENNKDFGQCYLCGNLIARIAYSDINNKKELAWCIYYIDRNQKNASCWNLTAVDLNCNKTRI